MQVESGIHELHEVVEGEQLGAHTGLVPEEIPFHPLHEFDKAPESEGVVLHDGVDGREEIAHALHVAEVAVVFIVGEQHVFHLLEMDVGADFGEGGFGVRMCDVFAFEEGDVAVGAVDVLFYIADPEKWVELALCL